MLNREFFLVLSSTLQYRPDIDGLRAIAVVSVVIYHLSENLLPGGFVGVDIFFVISGFLITRLIHQEVHHTKNFSFGRFYLRRIRRLFPAMLVTFLLCVGLAYALLAPQHLVDFGRSLIFATISFSNVYFWQSTDYFDFASQAKPLLHTWSLSVEEQFYMLWPLTLLLLSKFRSTNKTLIFITVLSIASLALNTYWFKQQAAITAWFSAGDVRSFGFYMLPFRVYEFGIGAGLVFINRKHLKPSTSSIAFLSGLALIVWSLVALDRKTDFPSFYALFPCLGAALMILAGPNHKLAKLICNRVMVALGLISYSVYLLHWPLIVFYKYNKAASLNGIEIIVIFVLSVVLGALMYRFVEQPFRKPNIDAFKTTNNKPFLLGALVSTILVLGIAFNAHSSKGWLWRYPPALVEQLSFSRDDYANYFWENIEAIPAKFSGNGKAKVLIIGDSMAADLINVFVESGGAKQIDLAAIKIDSNCKALFTFDASQYQRMYNTRAPICKQEHAKVLDNLRLVREADSVILATYISLQNSAYFLIESARLLKSKGAKEVLVLGQKDQQSNGMAFFARMAFKPNLHKIKTPLNANASQINELLANSAKGYRYVDLLEQFCNNDECQRVTPEGHLIIFDGTHLSQQGAKFIGQRLLQANWFKRLTAKP